ncbi:hypothetical protein [Clostridium tetanomorphum]|nr:hypothetical protein [Clostridium tetanomorphum]
MAKTLPNKVPIGPKIKRVIGATISSEKSGVKKFFTTYGITL